MDGGHVLRPPVGAFCLAGAPGITEWRGSYKAEGKDVLPPLQGGQGR